MSKNLKQFENRLDTHSFGQNAISEKLTENQQKRTIHAMDFISNQATTPTLIRRYALKLVRLLSVPFVQMAQFATFLTDLHLTILHC